MTVVCLGEILVDFVAREAGVSVGEAASFQRVMGGAPANVAVGVSRLGRSSAFLGCVGDDPFGRFLTAELRAEGVDVAGLQTTAAARTSLAFVSLDAAGERSFVFFRQPGADMLLAAAQLDRARLSRARIFHFGSFSLSAEPAASATREALRLARAGGALISYDPNLRLHLWPDAEAAPARYPATHRPGRYLETQRRGIAHPDGGWRRALTLAKFAARADRYGWWARRALDHAEWGLARAGFPGEHGGYNRRGRRFCGGPARAFGGTAQRARGCSGRNAAICLRSGRSGDHGPRRHDRYAHTKSHPATPRRRLSAAALALARKYTSDKSTMRIKPPDVAYMVV